LLIESSLPRSRCARTRDVRSLALAGHRAHTLTHAFTGKMSDLFALLQQVQAQYADVSATVEVRPRRHGKFVVSPVGACVLR
jgi:hypothetical protein